MNKSEFNEKYKDYLEEGHYGMAICDEDVINICDIYFQDIIETQIKGFTYSQIKTKFGKARVYMDASETNINVTLLETMIDIILKIKRENG